MDIKESFENIRNYLAQDQGVWNNEIIQQNIDDWPSKYKTWLFELERMSHYELWKALLNKSQEEKSFHRHLKVARHLTQIPRKAYKNKVPLPSWAFQKVKQKKQHEISVLAQALDEFKAKKMAKSLIDIGAGQGHFSRVMAHYYGWPTISIEMQKDLHDKGLQRLKKHPAPKGSASLEFLNIEFKGLEDKNQYSKIRKIFNQDSFSLGLHTCGPLANRHLETFKETSSLGILNFGCCYGKLSPQSDINLSNLSKRAPLQLSPYALNLAARAHQKMSYPDFCFQECVKTYRYTLEIYLRKHYPSFAKMAVGDAHLKDYTRPFCEYALKRFRYLGLQMQTGEKKRLADFFQDREIRDHVAKLFLADIIRWSYGRMIELYILLDRCLFLKESGLANVELIHYFDETLSPRNLGILAYKKEL